MSDWWDGLPNERYWCEITDRDDVGADLHAPQFNDEGREYWSYSLLRDVADGDIVFHYSTKVRGIIGASIADGDLKAAPVVWQAHGSAPDDRPNEHVPRPGWWRGLRYYTPLTEPLRLAELRAPENLEWIRRWIDTKAAETKGRVAAPFQRYGDDIRASQAYLTKLPADFVGRWPPLAELGRALLVDERAGLVAAEAAEATVEAPASEPRVETLSGPLEALLRREFEVHHSTESVTARRREQELVLDFGAYLEARGHVVRRRTYSLGDHRLASDLFDATDGVLYEAKGTSLRTAVRMAVGQLFDYRRWESATTALAILLPSAPTKDVLSFVGSVGIRAVWREGGGFREWNPDDAL